MLQLDGIGEQTHCGEVSVLVFLSQCGHVIVPTAGDSVKETWHLLFLFFATPCVITIGK